MSDPRRFIDLHMHSTASDGVHPPAELMRLAAARRLSAVALTDHDTTTGLAEAARAAAEAGMEFVPGIELSARFEPHTLHLLCYFIDPDCQELHQALDRIIRWRRERNAAILDRLAALGMDLRNDPELRDAIERDRGTAHVLGRPHIALALVRAGYVPSFRAAFDRLLARGSAAYVARRTLSAREALALIHAAGGVASLAHPSHLHCGAQRELETLLARLKDLGLDAVEAYHPDHQPRDTRWCVEAARRLDLALTGGSDFHGRPGVAPPRMAVGFSKAHILYEHLEALRARRNAEADRAPGVGSAMPISETPPAR